MSFAAPVSGGDFSATQAPTIQDVIPNGLVCLPAPGDGKGGKGKKGKGGRKGKAQGKGDATNGDDGNPPNEPPLEETTPIQKAKALAKSVFLGCIIVLFHIRVPFGYG